MKFKNPLLAVKDMERSKMFYREVLGLRVVSDFGANVTLTGGVALQTEESWLEFIGRPADYACGSYSTELYFEEDDFDGFVKHLSKKEDVEYVHPPKEHRWGQRVVRFCDPDGHIIEVGEPMTAVAKRFASSGMSAEEVAWRMDVPLSAAKKLLR